MSFHEIFWSGDVNNLSTGERITPYWVGALMLNVVWEFSSLCPGGLLWLNFEVQMGGGIEVEV